MSNKFILDSSSLEESDIKKSDSSVVSKHLPDISDVQRLFTKSSSPDINNKQNSLQSTVLDSRRTNTEYTEKKEDIENKESIENSPQGREIILYIDQIYADPKDNVSRSGKIYTQNDHEVQSLAHLIKTKGLINPVEVVELDEPIEREDGEFYTHKVVSGFKRFAALKYLGFEKYRFTIFEDLSEDDILIHNGIENWSRSDPTDYDLALYIALLHRKRNWSAQRIAVQIGGKIAKVESLLLIATKLPPELLEVFKVQPTPEVRRDLSRISLIERDTQEETHRAMMSEWIRIQNEKNQTKETVNNIPKQISSKNKDSKSYNSNQFRLADIRNEQAQANQWFDSSNNIYRPITEEMRQYADALIRHISDRKSRSIFK